jgi:hypothetical protein
MKRYLQSQLIRFAIGIALLGVTSGIFETVFNNYLHDTYDLQADARGYLEFPRELPGFLTALLSGLLFFVPETLVAAVSAALVGAGVLGIALGGDRWGVMLLFLVTWSVGAHLVMPVRSSIAMDLAPGDAKGRRLGQVEAVGTAAALVGCLGVWIVRPSLAGGYKLILLVAAVSAALASLVFSTMQMPGARLKRPKFVWRRRYGLYYALSFLFGARKQIFLTFGPWVLIKVFHQPAHIFAELWIVASLLGIPLQPVLGRLIDRRGERAVLLWDAALVFGVCAGYGFAHLFENRALALGLLYACYVGDQLLFGTGMARTTYLSRIAERPDHVSPTLSLGVSINHAVSMTIPSVGGLMWVAWGHSSVFLGAAGIALVMLVFAAMIRTPQTVAGTPDPGSAGRELL